MKALVYGVSLGLFVSPITHAVVAPVIDIVAIGKIGQQITQMKKEYEMIMRTYNNATQQYATLKNTYTNAKNQLSSLKTLENLNSGQYGWGSLKNAAGDLQDLQWSADTWSDTLKNISGGNSSRYQQLLSAYKKSHPGLSDGEFKKGASEAQLLAYKEQRSVTENADTQATAAYNNINKHHKNIHELAKEIESEKNKNTKSSIDLNSRMVAENAQIQTEMLKQLTILNKQAAQQSASELREREAAAKFNQIPID
jgi:type IV secretion system protein VirB5